jgi:hypothetical protein
MWKKFLQKLRSESKNLSPPEATNMAMPSTTYMCVLCGTSYTTPNTHVCNIQSITGLTTNAYPWSTGLAEPTPRKLPKPQETLVSPIIGWRRWSVPVFADKLLSNNRTEWKPLEKLCAECKIPKGPSIADPAGQGAICKGVHCVCGIYAYKSQADTEHGENAPTDDLRVYGEVYLWGRVIEHEHGYRAQYAYPKSLVNNGGVAAKLAHIYQVPAITVKPTPKPQLALSGNITATKATMAAYYYGQAFPSPSGKI